MGITTRVKGDMAEKKPFNFALFWDKYGTFFILAIIVAIFGTLSSEYFSPPTTSRRFLSRAR